MAVATRGVIGGDSVCRMTETPPNSFPVRTCSISRSPDGYAEDTINRDPRREIKVRIYRVVNDLSQLGCTFPENP